jgi:hypothetical protein
MLLLNSITWSRRRLAANVMGWLSQKGGREWFLSNKRLSKTSIPLNFILESIASSSVFMGTDRNDHILKGQGISFRCSDFGPYRTEPTSLSMAAILIFDVPLQAPFISWASLRQNVLITS